MPTIDNGLADIAEARARLAILDVLARYAFALDEKRFELLTDVFTEDAHIDMTSSGGIAGDRRAFIEWIPGALSLFPVTQHILGQSIIDFDADLAGADVHTYQTNPMGFGRADGTIDLFVIGGHYRDRLVWTGAGSGTGTSGHGWRIARRTWQQRWLLGELPAEMTLPTIA